jgi:hypothetical protein
LTATSSYAMQVVGGLAAFAYDTTIIDVHVRGTIQFTASNSQLSVGGLLGFAGSFLNASSPSSPSSPFYTLVENCSFTGNLEASGDPVVIAGGILGAHNDEGDSARIEKSYAAGKINAVSRSGEAYAGGIAGKGESVIEDCYAAVEVRASAPSGEAYAGGIIGLLPPYESEEGFPTEQPPSVTSPLRCYALGSVKAEGNTIYAGGIAGNSGSPINKCVALADVDGETGTYVGRVIGKFWLIAFWPNTSDPGHSYAANNKDIKRGITASEAVDGDTNLASAAFASGNEDEFTNLGWDFPNTWNWIDGYDYPVLAWQTSPPADPANPQSLH